MHRAAMGIMGARPTPTSSRERPSAARDQRERASHALGWTREGQWGEPPVPWPVERGPQGELAWTRTVPVGKAQFQTDVILFMAVNFALVMGVLWPSFTVTRPGSTEGFWLSLSFP